MGHLQSSCPKLSSPQYPPHSCNCTEYETDGCGEIPLSDVTCVDLSCRYWEASEHGVENVKRRLRQHILFWRDVLTTTPYILDVIENGYRLPLICAPPSYCAPNHSSTNDNVEFVTEAVEKLVHNGCAKIVAQKPFICSPLLVVQNFVGKRRLVISLKSLNLYLWKCKFKYEDFKTALDYFEENAYLFTFDLKSGYHHVDIHSEHQTYLGFQWEGRFYVFPVLPFGLSTACYMWHSRRKSTFRRQKRKMSFLYQKIALTSFYPMVLVALQYPFVSLSYKRSRPRSYTAEERRNQANKSRAMFSFTSVKRSRWSDHTHIIPGSRALR